MLIDLTPIQKQLFRQLSDGRWHTVEALQTQAMKRRFAAASLVPTHIGRLRKRLPPHQRIENAGSAGYRLVDEEFSHG